MRFEADGAAGRVLIDGRLVVTGSVFPLEDVAAPVTTGKAPCLAHAEMHLALCAEQVFHHLATRLPASHHQDRAIRQLGGISIIVGMELHDVLGQLAAPCREVRLLMGADSDDHVVGAKHTFGSV